MTRVLITLGLVLIAVGAAWPLISRLGLGRLPGDIVIRRGGFVFYFPLTTSIIVGLVLSLLFWLLRK